MKRKPKRDVSHYTINATIQDKATGKQIACMVIVRDGFAISTYSDPTLAKKIVLEEQKQGNKMITYVRKPINGAVQRYPSKTKKEIVEILKKELNNAKIK